MKKIKVLIALLGVVHLSGCSWYQLTHGETKPHISFTNLSNPGSNIANGSTIYVWSPKNNAAVINNDGKGCIQGADVFHNEDVSVNISNKLLEIVSGVAVSQNVTTDDKLAAINSVSKIVQLKMNTERISYLSVGMFGLCQLYSNGDLSEKDLKELIQNLITESAHITPKTENPTTVTSTKNITLVDEPKE